MSHIAKMLAAPALALLMAWSPAGPVPADTPRPKTICAAPLSNNTGDARYDALAEAIADMLAVGLTEHQHVTVVERQQLRKVLDEQKLSLAGLVAPATAVKVGRLLKADRILVGGMIRRGERLLVNAQVYEIASARLAGSVEVRGRADDVPALIAELAGKVGKGLEVELKPLDKKDIDKHPKASACFMRGLGFHFAGHYDRAVMEFMRAQDIDPRLDKAGYWMALSFMKNKEFKHALIELEKLLRKHPKSLLREEAQRRLAECRRRAATRPAATNPAAPTGTRARNP